MLQKLPLNHRFTCMLVLLSGLSGQASANQLSGSWTSCSDNNRSINTGTSISLNAQCLYQEIAATQNDNLLLTCETRTAVFTSIELAFSDNNFNVLQSSQDSTTSTTQLRAQSDNAPPNTRYAVATVYASGNATMQCSLVSSGSNNPPEVQQPQVVQSAPVAQDVGPCLDSDGDGYGWNGVSTCQLEVSTISITNQPNNSNDEAVCVDSDGDGFGWDGTQTCRVTASNNPTAGACIDSNNDGYGWDGVSTCRPVTTNPPSNATAGNSAVANTTDGNTAVRNIGIDTGVSFSDITDLVLITGQSNAQGNETAVDLAVLDAPNNRVFAFTDDLQWKVADLRQHWDGPLEVRHPGNNALIFADNTPHNNFAFHFGKALTAADPQRVVGIVLVSSPGAGIKAWGRNSSLYRVLSTKAAQALNASNKSSFDAILWHQGETDYQYNGTSDINATATERTGNNYYPDRLYRLISNLRQEAWFSTAKPMFICGETQTSSSEIADPAPVNRRLMALNSDSDPYTGCVSADGLQTTDGVHFNAPALRELGRRYARKYLELKR